VKKITSLYGIELIGSSQHPIQFVERYWNDVFEKVIDGYSRGETPNPDLFCNKYIKFDAMLNYVKQKTDAHFLATGHYAQLDAHTNFLFNNNNNNNNNNSTSQFKFNVSMSRGVDHTKDQSYFLAFVNKNALYDSLFPLGELYKKSEVRLLASDYFKFPDEIATKKDSVGICFIGKRKFKDFLSNYVESKPGNVISILNPNEVIGRHNGISYHTIGQKLSIGGLNKKWFVCEKDTKNNILLN
jgi:tRNA-specific 2-thiouridylase